VQGCRGGRRRRDNRPSSRVCGKVRRPCDILPSTWHMSTSPSIISKTVPPIGHSPVPGPSPHRRHYHHPWGKRPIQVEAAAWSAPIFDCGFGLLWLFARGPIRVLNEDLFSPSAQRRTKKRLPPKSLRASLRTSIQCLMRAIRMSAFLFRTNASVLFRFAICTRIPKHRIRMVASDSIRIASPN